MFPDVSPVAERGSHVGAVKPPDKVPVEQGQHLIVDAAATLIKLLFH